MAVWFGYREKRDINAHIFDGSKAAEVADGIAAFLRDAKALLARLEAGNG